MFASIQETTALQEAVSLRRLLYTVYNSTCLTERKAVSIWNEQNCYPLSTASLPQRSLYDFSLILITAFVPLLICTWTKLWNSKSRDLGSSKACLESSRGPDELHQLLSYFFSEVMGYCRRLHCQVTKADLKGTNQCYG